MFAGRRIVGASAQRLGQQPPSDRESVPDVNSPLFPVGTRLLAFARQLQGAGTFAEILDLARAEMRDAIGFDHAWLATVNPANDSKRL